MAILDKFPPPVRHAVLLWGSVFGLYVAQAVSAAGGVSGVDWHTVTVGAVNGACAAVAGIGILTLTPLTAQYGVGATTIPAAQAAADAAVQAAAAVPPVVNNYFTATPVATDPVPTDVVATDLGDGGSIGTTPNPAPAVDAAPAPVAPVVAPPVAGTY